MSYTLENLKKERKISKTTMHAARKHVDDTIREFKEKQKISQHSSPQSANYVVRHELQYHTVYRMFIFSVDFQVFLRTSK